MPKFIYTARSYSGQTTGGELVAKDEKSVALQLRADGFLVTSIKEIEETGNDVVKVRFLDRFTSIPLKEKMVFARNLSIMIASGLTVTRAVRNLSFQTKNKKFQKILLDVHDSIQAGKTFSESLAKYPSVFNELFVNMVRVGETGGNLDEVLNIVATQLEKEHDIISKVRGAMTYPAVILVAMIAIAILMLTYILPKILGVFRDMNVELPAATKFIIALSNALVSHGILVFVSFVALIFGLRMFLQRKSGKQTLSYITIHLPAISNIIIKVNCARFARIYSSLLKSGITSVEALHIISNTLTNYYYKEAISRSIEDIQKGVSLSKVVGNYPNIFPTLVSQIIEVGEETGKTEMVLLKLAEFYEEEVSEITKNMSSIVEPVLMIIIGSAVGFFAIAMLQPMYSLMDNIK